MGIAPLAVIAVDRNPSLAETPGFKVEVARLCKIPHANRDLESTSLR
jgi:hypothetical protein